MVIDLRFTAIATLLLLMSCGESTPPATTSSEVPAGATTESVQTAAIASAEKIAQNPKRSAYFGDLHVHTRLSFDAFLFGTRRTPDDAYLFAKGDAIEHASGFQMQMKKPLDFLGVSDHAFYLGMMPALADPSSTHRFADVVRGATSPAGSGAAFQAILGHLQSLADGGEDDLNDLGVRRSAWQEIVAAAERHNDPGTFTSFIAYEYTSSGPAFENLHRNVIFRGSEHAALPFSRLDSTNPEDLWRWMDEQRAQGIESLAIPHNSNGSNGWMFSLKNWAGEPLDADYAKMRMRNEPLVENTQVKGTSDTHPLLSPNDEWADFEIMPWRVATSLPSQPSGSYVREALGNGLVMQATEGFNPFQFGVIGSSDTHNAAGSFEEDNYWSKTGVLDIEPQLRGSVPLDEPGPNGEQYANGASQFWGGSGLAGVWAESNTREAIYDAFRRKETFSTSGPHIKVRFFAGYDFDSELANASNNIEIAYGSGVPMGAELQRRSNDVPKFFTWAVRDPDSGSLQRMQVVKGWVAHGEAHERVFDVACSDGGTVDPVTHRCPDNGARVDLATCKPTPNKGANELATVWSDPDFNPDRHAFYYVRVLENPICRWSTWDAIRAGVAPRPDMHTTIQDRAWTSPIWYVP